MAKQPTLSSNLFNLGIGSNNQQGLIGSDLSNIGILPLQDQLAKEIEKKQEFRKNVAGQLDTDKKIPLGPITFADDLENFIKQEAQNKKVDQSNQGLDVDTDVKKDIKLFPVDPKAGVDMSPTSQGVGIIDEKMELGAMSDADIDYTDVGEPGSLEPEPEEKTTLAKEQQALQDLFKETMKETMSIYGDAEKDAKVKTIEEYKDDFQKATGIDISGEPDNKNALMALGFRLMANRAGKDFDLSNILQETGKIGLESLPDFEKAKDKAKAGQLASGKFALGQKLADTKALTALNKEKRLALLGLGKEFRSLAEKQRAEAAKHLNSVELKELEFTAKRLEAYRKGQAKLSEITKNQGFAPIDGQPGLKVQKALRKDASVGNPLVYTQAGDDIRRFKDSYGNITRARNTLSSIGGLVKDLGDQTGSPLADQVLEKVQNLGVAIGLDPKKLFPKLVTIGKDGKAKLVEGVGRKDMIEVLNRTLINEYKKFLTQETGNGISNQDVDRLEKALGKIDLFGNPQLALQRINEIDQIFAKTQDQITNTLTGFKDRNSYLTDDQFNRAQKELKAGTVEQFGNSGPKFNVSTADDGTLTYTLVK